MSKNQKSRRLFLKQSMTTAGVTIGLLKTDILYAKDIHCFGLPGQSRYLQGIFKPDHRELHQAQDLIPVISPPSDFKINGAFLQQSSNSILADFTVNYHWFDGDGKPCLITFKDGKPSITSRFVQTDKYKYEKTLADFYNQGSLSHNQVYKKAAQGLYGGALVLV